MPIWMDRRAWQETQWVKDNIPHDKLLKLRNYVDFILDLQNT